MNTLRLPHAGRFTSARRPASMLAERLFPSSPGSPSGYAVSTLPFPSPPFKCGIARDGTVDEPAYTHGTCLSASVSSSSARPRAQGCPPSMVVKCRWNCQLPSAVAGGRKWPCRCPSPSCGGPAHVRGGGGRWLRGWRGGGCVWSAQVIVGQESWVSEARA